jgi:uncharacterized protein YndB with AHSA1/START domain
MNRLSREFQTEKTISAEPSVVFDLFSRAEALEQWFSPDPAIEVRVESIDFRPGGAYRFRYRQPDGSWDAVRGAYREIIEGKRLSFSWTWEPPDPHAGVETVVVITFEDAGSGSTLVKVHHEGFPDEASLQRHDAGWCATLGRLERHGKNIESEKGK